MPLSPDNQASAGKRYPARPDGARERPGSGQDRERHTMNTAKILACGIALALLGEAVVSTPAQAQTGYTRMNRPEKKPGTTVTAPAKYPQAVRAEPARPTA